MKVIRDHLIALYGEAPGSSTFQRVRQQLDRFSAPDGPYSDVSFREAALRDTCGAVLPRGISGSDQ
ncbi:MAG TPA: hypothetical protein VFF59_00785, partial [Anaerolineae bacterium]|nr:hypothetical protein [Anaerolineae bacterium]